VKRLCQIFSLLGQFSFGLENPLAFILKLLKLRMDLYGDNLIDGNANKINGFYFDEVFAETDTIIFEQLPDILLLLWQKEPAKRHVDFVFLGDNSYFARHKT
jgi:hypothetical protein